jgi:dTDP-glucose pyrophosphorylase
MLNIVIPMAGRGQRFVEKGYTFPKPLIEVQHKPMIQLVLENIRPKTEHRFNFICHREHHEKYAMKYLLSLMAPGCQIVLTDGITSGAACTVLLARGYIDNEDELLLVNSDQYIDHDINEFLNHARREETDGLIMTFPSIHPKWSFAKVDEDGFVTEVAEKRPISNHATVGIYYFRRGADFVDAALSMIEKDIRTNNEFYVCPTYNELLLRGKRVRIYEIPEYAMCGLGTPEDLEAFEKKNVKHFVT